MLKKITYTDSYLVILTLVSSRSLFFLPVYRPAQYRSIIGPQPTLANPLLALPRGDPFMTQTAFDHDPTRPITRPTSIMFAF